MGYSYRCSNQAEALILDRPPGSRNGACPALRYATTITRFYRIGGLDWECGQPSLAAAAFRGGSALDHRNGSCRCKAETSFTGKEAAERLAERLAESLLHD